MRCGGVLVFTAPRLYSYGICWQTCGPTENMLRALNACGVVSCAPSLRNDAPPDLFAASFLVFYTLLQHQLDAWSSERMIWQPTELPHQQFWALILCFSALSRRDIFSIWLLLAACCIWKSIVSTRRTQWCSPLVVLRSFVKIHLSVDPTSLNCFFSTFLADFFHRELQIEFATCHSLFLPSSGSNDSNGYFVEVYLQKVNF